jgi:nitroreductase
MELEKAILERRSVRQFTDGDIAAKKIEKLVRAGIWAPTAGNIQPWIFFCIKKPEQIHNIQVVSPGMLGNPNALICICSDLKRAYERAGEGGKILALFDCAMAAQNIMLRAHDLGIGSCVVRSFNQVAVRTILKAPSHIQPELIVMLGHPARIPNSPTRNEDVLYWEEYGNRGEIK